MNADGPSTWVQRFARETPERLAIASPSARLNYRELNQRIDVIAAALSAGGVGVGDRVLSSLPLCPAAAVIPLAAQRLGAVSVEVPRELAAGSRQRAIAAAHPQAGFVTARDRMLLSSMPFVGVVGLGDDDVNLVVGEDGAVAGAADAGLGEHKGPSGLDADALVLFTSGSSGAPAGVRLSFRNIAANARSIAASLTLDSSDHALCVLPLSYAYGRSILHSHLLVGASVYLDGRFSFPRVVMDAARQERCTSISGVPMTFEVLRRHVDLGSFGFTSLRRVTQAGGRLAPATMRALRASLGPTPLLVMYGATEATARLTVLAAEDAERKEGSIGRPIDGVRLQIVDEQDREVPTGVSGHLVARGDNIACGYLDDSERSTQIFRNGALYTGDLARVDDDGFYFLVGRASEMLKIGGHRTSPGEIEDEITAHTAIVEAAVIGMEDPLVGETAVALIVVKDGAAIDDAALRNFLSQRLPLLKVPRAFARVQALPRSENGKVRRADLRTLFEECFPKGLS